MFYRLFLIIIFAYSFSLKATEVTVIELHNNKTLDQLVLEEQTAIEKKTLEDNLSEKNENEAEDISENANQNKLETSQGDSVEVTTLDDTNITQNSDSQEVAFIITDSIINLNENVLKNYLEQTKKIQSITIAKEFLDILHIFYIFVLE